MRQSNNSHFEEDPFGRRAQGIPFIMHEVLLLLRFLQTKLQIKCVFLIYNDLYYNIIKNYQMKKEMLETSDKLCQGFFLYKWGCTMQKSRRCAIFKFGIHSEPFVKLLTSKKHLENEKNIPTNFFNEPLKTNTTKQKL